MKNIYVLLFLLSFHWALGQDCSIKTPLGSTIETYDWKQEQFDFWIKGCGLRHPYSPFWSDGNYNPNIRHLYGPPDDDDGSWVRDYEPKDGWELLYKHFGTQAKPAEVPVLMLYNRYESNIRLFFYLTPKAEYGGAEIQLFFNSNKIESALLNYVAQPQKALDDFRKGMIVHLPNEYENGAGGDNCEGYWILGDIPVAYDPCTCHNSTVLKMSPFLVDSATISLDINGGGTITQIASGGSYSSTSHTSVLQNISNAVNGAVAKGAKTAKTLQGFYNTANAIATTFDLIEFGNDAGSYDSNKSIVDDGVSSVKAKVAAQAAIDDIDERKKKAMPGLPKWMTSLPKIGVALGIIDFIIGGGKSGSKPKPTSFEADLNFKAKGKIITPSPYTSTRLRVPGAKSSPNPLEEEVPIYDNTLGIFTLLETPKVKKNYEGYLDDDQAGEPIWVEDEMQIQLAESIKYAVNPASGLVLDNIVFRFVLKGYDIDQNYYPDGHNSSPLDKIVNLNGGTDNYYLSPILSSGCIEEYVLDLYSAHEQSYSSFDYPEVFLEVDAILSQNSDLTINPLYDANADKVFIRQRYRVKTVGGEINDVANLGQIKSHEVIGDLVLTEDMTIYAWSTIEITGTIITNGHKLTVIAGNEITGNISDLPDGVDLIIGNPAGCGGSVPAQTTEQIDTFCTGDKYNPVVAQPSYPFNEGMNQEKPSKSYLSISPNPFQDFFKVTYSLAEEKEVIGFLYNTLGERVKEVRLEGGETEKELIVDCADLGTGIYFLTIQTESDLKTVKLMKQAE